jgi:hypothetical protein
LTRDHLICHRCHQPIRQAPPVQKSLRATGDRVDFHQTCWLLLEQSYAEKQDVQLRAQRRAERERAAE